MMTERRALIRTWALVAVAFTSVSLVGLSYWITYILSGQDWCARAVGAAVYANGRPSEAIQGCFALQTDQIAALAHNSYIVNGTLALSLLVLVVIVLAGGKLHFTASRDGVSTDIGADEAANRVADAAETERDRITGQ